MWKQTVPKEWRILTSINPFQVELTNQELINFYKKILHDDQKEPTQQWKLRYPIILIKSMSPYKKSKPVPYVIVRRILKVGTKPIVNVWEKIKG